MIEVQISSSLPFFVKANANDFGQMFSQMGDNEQVAVFRAMVEHMRPHKMQWDYIAIELQKPENQEVARELNEVLGFALGVSP